MCQSCQYVVSWVTSVDSMMLIIIMVILRNCSGTSVVVVAIYSASSVDTKKRVVR